MPCQNYVSENRNVCIVISFTIYSVWYKCTWNNDYRLINITEMINQKLPFYGKVFDSILSNVNQRKNIKI